MPRRWIGGFCARPGGYVEMTVRLGRKRGVKGLGVDALTAAVDALLGAAFGGGRIAIA